MIHNNRNETYYYEVKKRGNPMKNIVGCIIVKDNKVLMVKEAKKTCYGQWNFPAGKIKEFETVTEAAIRETFEETGYKVKLNATLPVYTVYEKEETLFIFTFIAEILEGEIKFDSKEILDVDWIDINNVKNMQNKQLRNAELILQTLKDYEKCKIFSLDLFE